MFDVETYIPTSDQTNSLMSFADSRRNDKLACEDLALRYIATLIVESGKSGATVQDMSTRDATIWRVAFVSEPYVEIITVRELPVYPGQQQTRYDR